jgi:alginate export protein
MKRIFLQQFILLTAALLFLGIEGQAQFQIDAQYRPRFEFRDGYRKLASDGSIPNVIISQRTRLSFSYTTEDLKIRFTPQDVRVWGDELLSSSTGVYGDNASLDLFEAYAEIRTGKLTWLSVGRQQLVYDYERLLSARNWNQNGLAYDAVVLKTNIASYKIHIGASWNALTETLTDNYYLPQRIKSLNFLWINRDFGQSLKASFMHIASGVTKTDTTNTLFFRQTSGIYFQYKNKSLAIKGDAYYQYGKNKNGIHVSAFWADADISYALGKLRPGVGLGFLSGNKEIGGETDHLFNVLYGARHRFFGHMDYFRDFSKQTQQGGLVDLYTYLAYNFSKTISLTNIGHYFQLAQSNTLTSNDKNLGYENELMLKYKFKKWGSVKSGYVFFLPTDSFEKLQSVSDEKFSQFFYLELTLKPVFFSTRL